MVWAAFNPLIFIVPSKWAEAESHFLRFCISPLHFGPKAAPSQLGRVQPCPSSPSPFPQLFPDLSPCTIPSSGGTNLSAVTQSKDKWRLQITPGLVPKKMPAVRKTISQPAHPWDLLAELCPSYSGLWSDLSSGLWNKSAPTRSSSAPDAHKFRSGVNTTGGWLEQLWSGILAPCGSRADGIVGCAVTHQQSLSCRQGGKKWPFHLGVTHPFLLRGNRSDPEVWGISEWG